MPRKKTLNVATIDLNSKQVVPLVLQRNTPTSDRSGLVGGYNFSLHDKSDPPKQINSIIYPKVLVLVGTDWKIGYHDGDKWMVKDHAFATLYGTVNYIYHKDDEIRGWCELPPMTKL